MQTEQNNRSNFFDNQLPLIMGKLTTVEITNETHIYINDIHVFYETNI